MPAFDLLLKHANLPHQADAAIGIRDGHIAWLGAAEAAPEAAVKTLDLAGDLLCPGFVDGHIHLDKTFLGTDWQPHIPCTSIRERIALEKRILAQLPVPIAERAAVLVELALGQGSTALRTHVDIDPDVGLTNLEAILQVRDRYRQHISIQIVAFPQSGVISCPGTLELLDQAIAQGADLVGGLDPAGIDNDVSGQLDGLFAIAERRGAGIDIHLHDPDQIGIDQLEQIAQRTKAAGLQGKVTVSHAYCLGMVPDGVLRHTADLLAAAQVAIMTNAPGSHAFPPILKLRQAGVTVFTGSDNIRDAWWPYGDADMLERAMMIGYRSGFLTEDELQVAVHMATDAGAQVLGLGAYGLQVGAIADIVALPAKSVPEAVVARPARSLVIKAGRVVARQGQVVSNEA